MPCAQWRKYDKAFACVRPLQHLWFGPCAHPLRGRHRAQDWLNDRLVVLGTKCNHLLLLDVVTAQVREVPLPSVNVQRQIAPELLAAGTLGQLASPRSPAQSCGIHAVSLSPDRRLMATGGAHVHDCQVFEVHTPAGVDSSGVLLTPVTSLVVRLLLVRLDGL